MIYSWHQSTWDKITKARSQDHLPHALLLTGEAGIGKAELAKELAKSLLCLSPLSYKACSSCKACKTFDSRANPDFLLVDLLEGKQQISVDQIRELSSFLTYTSSFDSYRVILLNPTERMNKNASNSLLKSLEEPSDKTVLILVTNNLSSVIPTIRSRCQLVTVDSPSREQALDWMKLNATDAVDFEASLEIANGRPLHAIHVDEELIKSKSSFEEDILSIVIHKNSITEVAKKWEKHDLELLIDWQLFWLQNLIKNDLKLSAKLKQIQQLVSNSSQWKIHDQLIVNKRLVHTSVNSLIFVENMLSLWAKNSQ